MCNALDFGQNVVVCNTSHLTFKVTVNAAPFDVLTSFPLEQEVRVSSSSSPFLNSQWRLSYLTAQAKPYSTVSTTDLYNVGGGAFHILESI